MELSVQLHTLAALTQGKRLGINSIGNCVGSRAGMDDVVMRKFFT
jgi:hypothetical protein